MIRAFDPVTEMFLASLQVVEKRISTDTEQLSSGYRVSRPSDSPEDVVAMADLEGKLSSAAQLQTNLTHAQNEADSSESALETAVSMMEQADVLATQALGISQDASTRAALAPQVQQLLQQMLGLSQLNVQGRFVFSGDNDQSAQYTLNSADTLTGVTRSFQTAVTGRVTDIFGQTFTAALTANDVFDHRDASDNIASDNVFAALEQLYQGLIDPNTTSGSATLQAAVGNIQAADTWLNNCLAFYGSVQNRLSQSQSLATQYKTMWTTQLGEKRDTDTVAAITDLETSKTQQNAALGAYSQYSGKNLFDYLP